MQNKSVKVAAHEAVGYICIHVPCTLHTAEQIQHTHIPVPISKIYYNDPMGN